MACSFKLLIHVILIIANTSKLYPHKLFTHLAYWMADLIDEARYL